MQATQVTQHLKKLIIDQSNQGTDFYDWVIDNEPKFSPEYPNQVSKKNYFKSNINSILYAFVKNYKITEPQDYSDFILEFADMIEKQTFPLRNKTNQITPPQQSQQPQPQPQPQINNPRGPIPNKSDTLHRITPPKGGCIQTPTVQFGYGEPNKKKTILLKLSECFDQPERRNRLIYEIRNEINQY